MDAKPESFTGAEPVEFDPEAWEQEPDLFDTVEEEALERACAEGMADIEAGRFATHEQVSAWLLSLGTENPLPMPQPWLK